MFVVTRLKQNILSFTIYKWGSRGSYLYGLVNVMFDIVYRLLLSTFIDNLIIRFAPSPTVLEIFTFLTCVAGKTVKIHILMKFSCR